ncbi:MAG: hypothetical protein ACO1NO_10010 [Burkholderiaceae bacterium]
MLSVCGAALADLPTMGDSVFFFVTEAFNFAEADLLSALGKDFSTAVPAVLEPDLTTALPDALAPAFGVALTAAFPIGFVAVPDAFLALPLGLADTVFAAGFAIDFADAALVAACFTFFVEDTGFCADFFIALAIGSTMNVLLLNKD